MSGFVLVWGTRVKEELIGSIAIDCPVCGERVVADSYKVLKAPHLYFIRGKFKEIQRYAKCRLCAVPSQLPGTTTPKTPPEPNIISPSKDFIRETNPKLEEIHARNTQENIDDSEGVPRHISALHQGIFNEINKQKSSSKAAGNAEGLIMIVLMMGLFFSMYLYGQFSNPNIFLTCFWATIILLVIIFYQFQFILMYKAAHKYLNIHIHRFLDFKNIQFQELLNSSSGLRAEFRIVKKYLSWAKNRM